MHIPLPGRQTGDVASLPDAAALYAPALVGAVEFATACGRNDGSVEGGRYFECRPRHGLFVRAENVSPASAAHEQVEERRKHPRIVRQVHAVRVLRPLEANPLSVREPSVEGGKVSVYVPQREEPVRQARLGHLLPHGPDQVVPARGSSGRAGPRALVEPIQLRT